jgi:hypothetical protein
MNIKENLNILIETTQATGSKILESKAAAIAVTGGTTYLGLSEWQSIGSVIATFIGIIGTSIFAIKNAFDLWTMIRKERREEAEFNLYIKAKKDDE